MGGFGGGVFLGFMLTNKEWLKIYENIFPGDEKKKPKKKNKNKKKDQDDENDEDELDFRAIAWEIAEEINGLSKTHLGFFKNDHHFDDEDYDRLGLGICVGRRFKEVSIDQMAKHMEQTKVLEEVGKTYGLGKPFFYVVDLECY